DRVGRRRIFVAGLIVFSVGSALCGLSRGVPELIAARVIQAAGAGLMVPASLSLLLASVPVAGRAKAIGTWSALGALGAAVGLVAFALVKAPDWGWGSARFPRGGGRVGRVRRRHDLAFPPASFAGDRARLAAVAHLQRHVRRVDPVLRGVRGVRAELGGVP